MRRMREEVDWLHHPELIPSFQNFPKIACESGGIAGNVDNLLRLMSKDSRERTLMHARTRRINDDAIECVLTAGSELLIEDIFRIAFVEADVADLIFPGGAESIFDSRSSRFYPHHFLRKTCEVLADGANATVTIEHRVLLREVRHLRNALVEFFCSECIRLEEGEG